MLYICRSKSASYDNPWQYQTILELLSHLVLDIIKSISRTTGHYFSFLLICIHINHLDIEYWQAVMENKTRTRYESALTVKHISCLTSCTGCWYPFSGKKYKKNCHQKAVIQLENLRNLMDWSIKETPPLFFSVRNSRKLMDCLFLTR